MKYFKKIQGMRVYLSPMNVDDKTVEMNTKWINNPKVSDNLGNSFQVYSQERERAALEDMARSGFNFSIVLAADDELLGNVSFIDVNHIHRNAQCGIFIGEESNRNKGYGSEALTLLLKFGFETLNLNNVMLKVFSFNTRGIACYEKVGFKVIGERRNAYFVKGAYYNEIYMDILAEEWNAMNADIKK